MVLMIESICCAALILKVVVAVSYGLLMIVTPLASANCIRPVES